MRLEDFCPGVRVCVEYRGCKMSGMAGYAWGDGTRTTIVKFDSGEIVEITEEMAEFFELGITN